jgi:hypothetical protein
VEACQPRSIKSQSHHRSVSDVIGITCHPEPRFFGGEGSSKTQSQGFFRLAKNASLQKDILRVFSSGSNLDAIALRCIIFIRSGYRSIYRKLACHAPVRRARSADLDCQEQRPG